VTHSTPASRTGEGARKEEKEGRKRKGEVEERVGEGGRMGRRMGIAHPLPSA